MRRININVASSVAFWQGLCVQCVVVHWQPLNPAELT
jgi:hypothetical protein